MTGNTVPVTADLGAEMAIHRFGAIELHDPYADAFEIHVLRDLRAHLRQAHTERNQSITDPIARAWLRCDELGTAAHLARTLANSVSRKSNPARSATWRIRAEIILAEADRVAAHAEALEASQS